MCKGKEGNHFNAIKKSQINGNRVLLQLLSNSYFRKIQNTQTQSILGAVSIFKYY